MSKDPSTFEPRSFVAGATVTWSKSLEDYPAGDGWVLKYALRGPDATGINVTAATDPLDGDDFLVTIASTDSDKAPGTYRLIAWVEKAGEKYYVVEQPLVILAKPADSGALDTRSDARIIYDELVALFKTKALMVQAEYLIAGRHMKFESYTELLLAIKAAAATVRQEQRLKRASEGGNFFPKVSVRF
jgi:hypothetical protein